jgi:hypothetical protein
MRRPSLGVGPWRVFLSHTSDLRQYPLGRSFVAAAEAAVIRAGHAITDMAYFAARDQKPADYCSSMVARAHVYVGIVGHRYGAVVRGRGELSYTELEFETATELGLVRLVFLIPDHVPLDHASSQSPELYARQAAFRARLLEAGLTTAWIASPTDLEIGLHQSLVQLQSIAEAQATPSGGLVKTASGLILPTPPSLDLMPTGSDATDPIVAFWMRVEQPGLGHAIALMRRKFDLSRTELVDQMSEVTEDGRVEDDGTLVWQWEKGEEGGSRTQSGTRYRRLLALVCKQGMEMMTPLPRREFLQQLAMLANPSLLAAANLLVQAIAPPPPLDLDRIDGILLHEHGVDHRFLDDVDVMTVTYGQMRDAVAPTVLLQPVGDHRNKLLQALPAAQSDAATTRLQVTAARTSILNGWLMFNLRRFSEALSDWTLAYQLATEANHNDLHAYALACRSRLYSQLHRSDQSVNVATARSLLDAAVTAAAKSADPALRSWILANRAEQLAHAGDEVSSRRDLDAAYAAMTRLGGSDEAFWSRWSASGIEGMQGNCARILDHPGEAIRLIENALAGTSTRLRTHMPQLRDLAAPILQLHDLAAAYVGAREIDQACRLLADAHEQAWSAGFTEVVARITNLRSTKLTDWSNTNAVRNLDEQLRSQPS